jgi:hypothetical protein
MKNKPDPALLWHSNLSNEIKKGTKISWAFYFKKVWKYHYFQHQESGLHIAVWHGFPRIVEILCQAGANLDIKNEVKKSHFLS